MRFGPKITAFLAAIEKMPVVSRAAKAAGIARSAHYAELERNPEYSKAFEKALKLGYDAVSDIAIERASLGWNEPIVYQGSFSYPLKWDDAKKQLVPDTSQPPLTVRKIDNQLLQFILKNRHPEYRERQEVTGAGGGPINTALEVTFVRSPRKEVECEQVLDT